MLLIKYIIRVQLLNKTKYYPYIYTDRCIIQLSIEVVILLEIFRMLFISLKKLKYF